MKNLLGMCWRGEAYHFVGMPFVLNDAPRIFTKIMKFVVRTIREIWNIKVVIYLDNILILHQDKDHLEKVGQEVTLFLQRLGWVVNIGVGWNVQILRIGMEFSRNGGDADRRKERRVKIRDELRRMRKSVYNHKLIPVGDVAKLMGILSTTRIQFPLSSLHLMKINA
jgi:hypothetical protein